MRLLIALLLPFFCSAQLVEIVPDSISAEFTMVNKGLTSVMRNGNVYSQHQRGNKADGSAYSLYLNNPLDSVSVVTPRREPQVSYRVFVDQSKLSVSSEVLERIEILETQTEIQANTIGKLLQDVQYIRALDSLKIAVLERRIDNLNTFIRDSIAFVGDAPIDYSIPIIKGFDYDTTGWLVNTDNDTYQFLDETDTRYIVFDFNRPLKVGETYLISFDIESTGFAFFTFWLYTEDLETFPEGYENPRVSNELTYYTGSHSFEYTVEYIDRIKLGLRARTYGDAFTISDIEITKLDD